MVKVTKHPAKSRRQQPEVPTRGPTSARYSRRLSREELTPEARDAIFTAAAAVIGEHGYVGATIKRITDEAGIAQGTFYLYFESRQALFDTLLPRIGSEMLRFIGKRVRGSRNFLDAEERAFRAFFEYLSRQPGFIRILSEAEWAAPIAHREHFVLLATHYRRALLRGISQGDIRNLNDDELETVSYMLMAARNYIYIRYLKGQPSQAQPPEAVVEAYMKFVRSGIAPDRGGADIHLSGF